MKINFNFYRWCTNEKKNIMIDGQGRQWTSNWISGMVVLKISTCECGNISTMISLTAVSL